MSASSQWRRPAGRQWFFVAAMLALFWASTAACCSSIPVHPGVDGEAADDDLLRFVDDRVRSLMHREHVPGLSVGIVDDQSTVVLRGYGYADRERGVPATPETVYRAYSIAKVFTALETMRLVDEGLIALDEPLEVALPEWREPRRRESSGPVTVRQLLAHRSGLPRNANFHGSLAEVRADALRAQVASLAQAWAAYPAGVRYKYSNVGFNVLGRIIETKRGELFAEYLSFRALPALGMRSSAFLLSALPPTAVVATGYEYYQSRYYAHPAGDLIQLASGNLFASVADLAGFIKRLLAAGRAPDDALPMPRTLQEMYRPQFARPGDPQRNGLGWMTSEEALSELMIWHQGGDFDANALIALLPGSRLGVTLLSNAGSYDGSTLVELAVDVFRAMLEKKRGSAPSEKRTAGETPRASMEPEELASYRGRYIAFGETLEVSSSGGQLRAQLGPAALRLDPAGVTESGTVFEPHHWLEALGLGGLFPIDLGRVRIVFPPAPADGLLVSVLDLDYEFCPRYPVREQLPESWVRMRGSYDGCEVTAENGMLRMSAVGYLAEQEPGVFVVFGGPFAGETVVYDAALQTLHHQGFTYPRAAARVPKP